MPSAETETTEETETEAVATDSAREALLEALAEGLGDSLIESHLQPGVDLTIRIKADAWAEAASFMRDHQRFRYFDWLSAIDWMPSPFGRSMDSEVDKIVNPEPAKDDATDSGEAPAAAYETGIAGGETRFQVFARVYNLTTQLGVTIKADVPDPDAGVASWINVYPGADWHEREIHEMFGINIVGHPRLHALYLPGDFEGHPMRKDFPLLARIVKPWPGIVDVEPMPGEDDGDDS